MRLIPVPSSGPAAWLATLLLVPLLAGCGGHVQPGAAPTGQTPAALTAEPPERSTGSVPVGTSAEAVEADLLVTASRPLTAAEQSAIRVTTGVQAVHPVDTGTVTVAGHQVQVLGVEPAQFRRWAPTATRLSDPLWTAIAAGQVSSTSDASTNLGLTLGSTLQVAGTALRLGAIAAMGLPGYDLTVSAPVGRGLGLTPGAALLVSAPTADLAALRNRLAAATPIGVSVALLRDSAPAAIGARSFLPSARIAQMVATATAQTGKPYVWGATGPASFDCSGLVGYAFAAIGVTVPRTSQQLWLSGPKIPSAQAQSGDLLFWSNDPAAPGDIDHVAIYLGGGQMVSAPHTGDIVHISSVPGRNFRGVVRPDPARALRVGGPMWAGRLS